MVVPQPDFNTPTETPSATLKSNDRNILLANAQAQYGNIPLYWNGNDWVPQYTLNNKGVTQEQWQAGQNPTVQAQQNINDTVNQLLNAASNTPVPTQTVPKLDFQMPSSADLQAKWQEFINRARNDSDIVKYYNDIYNFTQGDLKLAQSYIERDYVLGVRHAQQNVTGVLASLGLTSLQEQQELAGKLNQRGIALTQAPNAASSGQPNTLTYAGGGQAGTELSQLTESQKLRQEAEQRSKFDQPIEQMKLQREKNLTDVGQQAVKSGIELERQKQQDILTRAQQGYQVYQGGLNADLMNAQIKQSNQMYGGGSATATKPPYSPNVVNQTVSYGGQTWKGNPGQDWILA